MTPYRAYGGSVQSPPLARTPERTVPMSITTRAPSPPVLPEQTLFANEGKLSVSIDFGASDLIPVDLCFSAGLSASRHYLFGCVKFPAHNSHPVSRRKTLSFGLRVKTLFEVARSLSTNSSATYPVAYTRDARIRALTRPLAQSTLTPAST